MMIDKIILTLAILLLAAYLIRAFCPRFSTAVERRTREECERLAQEDRKRQRELLEHMRIAIARRPYASVASLAAHALPPQTEPCPHCGGVPNSRGVYCCHCGKVVDLLPPVGSRKAV